MVVVIFVESGCMFMVECYVYLFDDVFMFYVVFLIFVGVLSLLFFGFGGLV